MDDRALLRTLKTQFALDWKGIHGIRHWERVRENGLRLAPLTGARPRVVELFALLHDARRESDGDDPEHGSRAAELARGLALGLDRADLDLLAHACRDHSKGLTDGDVTVTTCWDADRLDLGRVGKRPHPSRLCTAAARDPAMIEWAYSRSLR